PSAAGAGPGGGRLAGDRSAVSAGVGGVGPRAAGRGGLGLRPGVNRRSSKTTCTSTRCAPRSTVPWRRPTTDQPPRRGGAMIARIWKGAVRRRDGDAYARYMQDTGVAGYAGPPGNRGGRVLGGVLGDRNNL